MKKFILLFLLLIPLFANAEKIPSGTLIVVQPTKFIDADEVKLNEKVNFITVEPVKIDGKILINPNTEVQGTVVKRKNNGILGIPGKIGIGEFILIQNNEKIIRLRGDVINNGENRYWANVGWVILWPLLFVKGDDGQISEHNTFMLYTAEDYDL